MGSIGEISHLCRLCLVKEQVNIPIFEEQGDIRQIFLKICSCLPVKITKEDSLPKKICDGCSQKLDSFYQFWKESSNSEKQLLAWLNNSNFDVNTITNQAVLTNSNKSSDTLILKQEIVDINDSKNEGSSIDYLLQQQQLPYQQNFNRFSQQEANATVTSEVDLNDEPPPAKRKKRAAPTKKRAKSTSDSEEDDDLDAVEAKVEGGDSDDSDNENDNQDPDYIDDSSHLDDQPGPSGVTKNLEAPKDGLGMIVKTENSDDEDDYKPLIRIRKELLENSVKKENKKNRKTKRKYDLSKTWSCKKCDEVFPTVYLLRLHRKSHVRQDDSEIHTYKFDEVLEIYVCNTCSAEYQEKHEIEKHLMVHEQVFECKICKETFKKAYNYGTHMIVHSDDKKFRCPLCTYQTPKRTGLLIHINYVHLKKFYYSCETCGKGFNDIVLFKEHNNEHLGLKPFVCVVCNKSFTYSRYLQVHQIRYHRVGIEGKLLPNQCPICAKVFGKQVTLSKHLEDKHKKEKGPHEKKHLCDTCGKGFAQKNKLKIHYRVHTGYKPYTCSYCAKSFTKKDYLVMHERVHTGEKPYSCEYCGKCFSQGAPLRIHLRSHTGERPYLCHLCDCRFASRGVLNMHFQSCSGKIQ